MPLGFIFISVAAIIIAIAVVVLIIKYINKSDQIDKYNNNKIASLENMTKEEFEKMKYVFSDLILFYDLKLKLYKIKFNNLSDTKSSNVLYSIEKTLKTVPSKKRIIVHFIIFSFLLILSCLFILFIVDWELVLGIVIAPFVLATLISLIIHLTKRNTKLKNISNAFEKLDYNQKAISEETKNTEPKEVKTVRIDSNNLSVKEKLRQLKELYEEGLITESEYNEQKKDYISKL